MGRVFISSVVMRDAGCRDWRLWVGVCKRCRVDQTTGVWKTFSFAFLPESVFISWAEEGYGQTISAGRVRSLVMSSAAGGCLWGWPVGTASSSPASAASRVLNASEVGPGLSRWQLWETQLICFCLPSESRALPLRRCESCFFPLCLCFFLSLRFLSLFLTGASYCCPWAGARL